MQQGPPLNAGFLDENEGELEEEGDLDDDEQTLARMEGLLRGLQQQRAALQRMRGKPEHGEDDVQSNDLSLLDLPGRISPRSGSSLYFVIYPSFSLLFFKINLTSLYDHIINLFGDD